MALYLTKKYGRPIHFSKSNAIVRLLKQKKGVYSSLNYKETEKLKKKLKDYMLKGLIMFNVAIWSDATGHFDISDNVLVKGKERFLEAHEIFVWPVEN